MKKRIGKDKLSNNDILNMISDDSGPEGNDEYESHKPCELNDNMVAALQQTHRPVDAWGRVMYTTITQEIPTLSNGNPNITPTEDATWPLRKVPRVFFETSPFNGYGAQVTARRRS